MKKIFSFLILTLTIFAQVKLGNVLSPNGGEYLTGDSVFTIRWSNNKFHPQYTNVSSISIDYSTNNGTSFTNIITGLSKVDSTYIWSVPALNIFDVCRVRVLYRNSSNQVIGGDTSDVAFSIDSKPFATISLTSPVNAKWVNTLPILKWSATGFSADADSLVLVVDGINYATFPKTANTYTFTTPLNKGWHSWTVRVVDARKNYFQALETRVFRVDDETPFAFAIDKPDDNSFTSNYYWSGNQENEFKWSPSADTGSGLKRYYLYIDGNKFLDTIPAANSIMNNRLLFYENFEAGLSKWTNVGGWGLASQNYYSSSSAATESPAGNYNNNLNASLTLRNGISLSNIKDLRVSYWCSYKLEIGDYAYFDISFNGVSWQNIASYTGISKMALREHNIMSYVGSNKQLYLRFRVVTNSSGTNDGFIVDDIKVTNLEKRIASGNHTWYIVAEDSVGNTRQSSNTYSFVVDTIAPQGVNGIFENVSPVNNLWTRDSIITFNWLPVSDNSSGFKEYQLMINNNLVQDSLSNNTYTLLTEQNLPSGNYTWYVKALDNIRNEAQTTPFNLYVDHTPPKKFNLLTPLDSVYINNPNPQFTWQASADSGIGLSKYQLIIDEQVNIDSITSNKTQTYPNPANLLTEGIHQWYIKAFDKLNNEIASNQTRTLIVDWTAPIIPTLTYPLENNIIDNPFPTFKWLPTTDNLSGVSYYNLYLDNNLVASNIPHLQYVDTISFKAKDSLKNGNHTWYVLAFDRSGNFVKSEVKSFTANIDYTPPIAVFSNLTNNQVIGGNSYLIMGTASDNQGGVGLNKVQLSFDGGKNWVDIAYSQPSPKLRNQLKKEIIKKYNVDENDEQQIESILNQTVYWDYNWQAYTNGTYDIRLRAIDRNNNIQSPVKVNVIVDKTLPTINSTNITNKYLSAGIKTIQINFKTSNKTSMDTLKTVSVEVVTANNFRINVQKTGYANNVWSGQVDIPAGAVNGRAYLKVTSATDKANNVMSADSSITFYIDTQAPTAPVITSPKNLTFINNLKPKISWSQSTDSLAGLNNYELEINGSTTAPGKSWISPTRTDTFPTANLTSLTNILRIKAVDKAGNFTYSNPVTFYIDTLKPTSQILTPVNGSNITQYPIIVTGTAQDQSITPVSGIDSIRIRFKKNEKYTKWYYGSFSDTVNKNEWSFKSDITDIGTYYVEAYAVDKAGNVQAVPAVNIFTVSLGIPAQVYPENNTTSIPKQPKFQWLKGLGARNYHLQVAKDAIFNQLVYNDSTLVDTFKTVTTLQNNNTYYWRIRSKDGSTYSAWSPSWSFTTRLAFPILYTSVDTLKFGNVIKQDSLINTFVIKNLGDDTLKASLSLNSTLSGFKFTTQNITIKPLTNDSVVVSVKFIAPSIIAQADAFIKITYGTNEKSVILLANVVNHPLQVSADTIKFDEVNLNTLSTKIITITNESNENINLTSATITGQGYSITSTYNYPVTLPAGQSINYNIAFLPTQNRLYTGNFEIKSNKPSLKIPIKGFGYQFSLGVDSLALSNLAINYGRSFNYAFRPTGLRNGSVKLFYRKAGDLLYDSVTAVLIDSVNYRFRIDSNKITLRGILFYIKGTNGTTTITIPSRLPENNPFNLKINLPSGLTATNEATRGTTTNAYRMISIPVNEILGYPDTVFSQFTSEYDPKKYRLFNLIDTNFVELNKGNFTRLATGKGYWFITNTKGKLKSGKGSLYPVNRAYTITLQPGFNVIGSPYNFDISWNDVIYDSTKISSLYTFDGTFKRTTIIKPWEGYLVKNKTNSAISINLIPKPLTVAKKENIKLNDNELLIKLSAETDNFIDDDNYIGFKSDATDHIDKYDDIKPVIKFDNYLYLINKEKNENLTQNIKKTKLNGDSWDFTIKSLDNSKTIKLKLAEVINLPQNFNILYLDKENKKSYLLTENNNEIIFEKEPNKLFTKNFTLLVGTKEYIERNNGNIAITPKDFTLAQNYPNPFNPETKIKYTLPEKSNVILKIYNVLGQEVVTLVNEMQNPGEYLAILSISNYNLSSGVYFYRIIAKSTETGKIFTQSKKMIILK
ncbi:MAG TPA: T9SS type A sorting domain-containing protein [Ignavibacteriales bacterium]|nr:T9SS type A sorting domain-containing protein [Ignavibacteriales bacterium]HOL81097.1 T9SS type A sorting domain-containing protein [Ignavibacteriales bacterium]HOM66377.1 T9SS type A sorting domain-containing protein [Ignavibacteriales bacterium]HPD66493.1 T9SS type A sorting domain-containing protein [Ignavibacteriales bacterium]HRR19729.1 T9SS type A sorting domain-containing protein [Ignavibacteriales bacterium]